jgi:hypothetical protein
VYSIREYGRKKTAELGRLATTGGGPPLVWIRDARRAIAAIISCGLRRASPFDRGSHLDGSLALLLSSRH